MTVEATQSPPHAVETIRLDTAFHRAYVQAGAGRQLRSFHDSITPQTDRFIHVYHTTLTTEIIVSTAEHTAARLCASIALVGERGV